MKLVFIRHCEPDYEKDSLTEKGFREAALLAPRIKKMNADYFYVSPQGRAKATAKPAMELIGAQAIECDWLHEFRGRCVRPHDPDLAVCWDWRPEDMENEPLLFDCDRWFEIDALKGTNVKEQYDYVISSFDALLAEHGYVRDGRKYKVVKESHDTLVFFCHYALTCVFLSHLLNVSPYLLWTGTAMQASSVTMLASEERVQGKAYFRMLQYGDISHLYEAGEEPSFMVRFCECYSDDVRHD